MPRAADKPAEEQFSITDLARDFNVTTRTIRFYEDEGLLAPERRGSKRIYHARDYTRLKLILRGKRLGFALNEIRELFELYDLARDEKPQLKALLQNLGTKRAALEQQKVDLDAILEELNQLDSRCREILQSAN